MKTALKCESNVLTRQQMNALGRLIEEETKENRYRPAEKSQGMPLPASLSDQAF